MEKWEKGKENAARAREGEAACCVGQLHLARDNQRSISICRCVIPGRAPQSEQNSDEGPF